MSTFNIGHFLTQNAQRFGDHPGVVVSGQAFTWLEVDWRVNRLAGALLKSGIRAGDRILVQARNSHRALEVKWACFKLGAVWVPVNFRLMPAEVAYMAGHASARAIVFDGEFAEHCEAVRAALHAPPLSVCLDAALDDTLNYEQLLAAGDESFVEADVERDQPAWFFYTSGTTGRPKAAVLTHGQLAFVVASHLADMFPGTSENDASLVITPLSHGAGVHALAHVARAAPQIILTGASLDPETVWKTVAQHKVTNFFAVPTLLKTLVEHPTVDRYDHSSLRHVNYGGAPMFRSDQALALAKLGNVLVQHYGLGEFTANITSLSPGQHEAAAAGSPHHSVGSCGVPRTGVEVAILDNDGQRLAAGETGEICARGQAAFAGYHNDPDATEKAFRHGWFHTGDLGFLDERGFLHITGRASDMYISGGLNVYPREIEEAILDDERIDEAAVVGMPHPKWGECGVAVVVVKAGCEIAAKDVIDGLNGHIARYKFPNQVVFWPELPKSAYGKVLKREIVKRLAEEHERAA
ncbi:AMP-binding protein [Mesorhizobium sp.]|uniref:AMP-binding protein n=1 Tax=Mesorhizobium sp. TaxID=1871066 RepID=UPI000FE4CE1B|nr:AMP-binding protein [Mesorhizobium sp.]RWO93240.1 MAG: acyl-CoA synthetase [Mesorhizobium sp.]RWQ51223.1 MAG: acyl-CoA synthetase [Mesorhizobium sp.]